MVQLAPSGGPNYRPPKPPSSRSGGRTSGGRTTVVPGIAGSPFENPALNKFLHALSTTSVGPSRQANTTGGYTPANISGYIPNFSAAQKGALSQAGITPQQAVTSQKVLDILKEVQGQNAEIQANGGQVPDTSHHHGIFSRVMDVISRPMYAMAEGSKEIAESVASGKGVGADLAAFGSGAAKGLEGKDKTDFIQVLQTAQDVRAAKKKGMSGADAVNYAEAHPGFSGSTGAVGKIGGFGLDIIGDPLTYVGLGAVSKGAKAVELATGGADALSGISAASKLSPETRDLISGLKYAKGDMTKSAATAAEGKVGGIAQRIAKVEGSHAFDKTLAENLRTESKAGTEEFYPVNDREILHLAKTAKANREQEVMSNILNNYNKVTSEAVNRHLAIKLPGMKVAIPGIPNLDLVTAAVKGAANKVNPISRSMVALKKGFQTTAKAMPELHEAKLQAFDFGMSQARVHGREIKRALNPLGKDGRTEAWTAFLNGHASNQMIKLPNGGEVEATKWIGDRINNIKLTNLEKGWKPEDWKPFLPPGLELKAGKVSQDGKMVKDPNWFTNSLKDWNVKDGGKAQWFIESAFHQLSSYKTMLESMGENFGAHLPEEHSVEQLNLYKGLQEKGWVSPKGVPELSAHVFPPEVAGNIHQIVSLMKTEKEWNKFWRGWAKVQAPVKFMLTLPNPSFHVHNSIGDMFVNHLDKVMPSHYLMSGKVMRNRSKWFEQYIPGENPGEGTFPLLTHEGDPLKTAAETAGPNANLIKNTMRLRSADGKINSHITQAEVYAGYNKYGLRQNYASDLGLTENSPIGALKGMIDKITSASEAREDYFRMAHFIALIEKNPNKAGTLDEAMNIAARRVRQTHFDYTDFTKFEKQVMSQIVPFYKWTRKALPLMSQVLITHPGDAALIPKSLRLMSALTGNVDMTSNDTLPNLEGAIVPDWMRTSGYVPVGDFFGTGNQSYGYISNPLSDMFTQQFGGVSSGSGLNAGSLNQTLMGMLSPLIKIPDEIRQNKNSFTGAKIVRTDPGSPSIASQVGNYAASQVPIANAINRAQKGHVDTPFNWLTGMSIHEDDPQRQLGELLRQRDVGRAILRKLRYQHGGHLSSQSSGWKNS